MTHIYIGLPAYNEALSIEPLFLRILALRERLKKKGNIEISIILYDDGSTDNTYEVANQLGKKLQLNFFGIKSNTNMGLGTGLREIIKTFLSKKTTNDSTFLCIMDCDDTHDPVQIIEMYSEFENNQVDVVVASRYLQNATQTGVPRHRVLTASLARIYLQALFGYSGVRDFTCGYRMYNYESLHNLSLRTNNGMLNRNDFAAMPELLLRLISLKVKFREIPLQLKYDRKAKPSTMKVIQNSFAILKLGIDAKLGQM